MTIRKRLALSNILMVVVPLIIGAVMVIVIFNMYAARYLDSLEEMYEDKNGIYSAQSIVYAYRDELSKEDWSEETLAEQQNTAASPEPTKKMSALESELTDLGYHFRVTIDGMNVFNNMSSAEGEEINGYFANSYDSIGSLTLSDENSSIIKNTFLLDGKNCEIAAVCMTPQGTNIDATYLKRHIFSMIALFVIVIIASIAVTNFCLSRWVTRMILKPLDILRKGAREIADGNLDFAIDYDKPDEMGEVCREFDGMRTRLKDSVETRLRYEKYRRELIVGISHDLRTPLTSIIGYIEGLRDGIANTEEKRQRYYRAVRIRALDMEALVDSLSTFAKLETKEYKYNMEPVNMAEYIQQLINEYAEDANRKHAIVLYNNKASNVDVALDIQETHRVFINLFENSIRYRTRENTVIRILTRNNRQNLEILVADDGPGVPEGSQDKIFESFYRADESRTGSGSGSGLGLAIAKQIIEGQNGTIRAYNENGLVILITLPLYKKAE